MKLTKRILTKFVIMILAWVVSAQAEEHDHGPSGAAPKAAQAAETAHSDHEGHADGEKEHPEEKGHAEHGDEEGAHKEEGKGEEGEEGSSAVGPEKGITEKGPLGFKLSPEATKTINFKTVDYSGGTFSIPKSGLVKSKNEKSIFRLRQGWIKRIPVEVQSKQAESIVGKSSELAAGDKIITTETGILRISEIFAEGGASHGHSH